jgi:hypothetical protein
MLVGAIRPKPSDGPSRYVGVGLQNEYNNLDPHKCVQGSAKIRAYA